MFRRLHIGTRRGCRVAAHFLANAVLGIVFFYASGCGATENIKIGTIKATNAAALFIAQEKGYFAAEGIPVEVIFFDAAQPIALAMVAGSIDFGVAAPTGGLYSLAGEGALRIIAGGIREAPGFQYFAYLASGRAYEAGLKSPRQLAGHAVAITQIGSSLHYVLGLLADKYQFDLKTIRLLPLQSIPNALNAVVGGEADATVLPMLPSLPTLIQKGDIRVLGWVGDETPWQFAAVFTTTKTADQRRDVTLRFLRAYRKGVHDYHDAFTGPGEVRKDGPSADAVRAIIATYTGLTIDAVKLGIPYIDPEARLDVKDILQQIAWYKSQGMVKPNVDGNQLIDKRYVVPLPGQ